MEAKGWNVILHVVSVKLGKVMLMQQTAPRAVAVHNKCLLFSHAMNPVQVFKGLCLPPHSGTRL